MSCRHVRDWLHRDSAELDEAQRLILDDHLAGCDRCQADRARLRRVHAIGTHLQPGLEPRDYNRAIARALMEGSPRREPAPPRRRWVYALAGLALAGAASAAVGLGARGSERDDDVVTPAPSPSAPVPQRDPVPPAPPPSQPAEVVDATALVAADQMIAAGAIASVAVTGRTPPAPPPHAGPTLAELLRLAETAQAEGRLETAIEHYREIASAFRAAPEAESALYAAARLEIRLGHAARATALLDDYLTRYPRGRYVDDVRRELTVIR